MRIRLAGAAIAAVGLVVVPAGAVLAAPAGGYGPTAPTGAAGAPGGYTTVLATRTVGPGGGTVLVTVPGAVARITVPAGAFAASVQVEVTGPRLTEVTAGLSAVGFPGYAALAGLGVKVLTSSGQPITGSFARPVQITLVASSLRSAGEKVLRLDGPVAASVMPAVTSAGQVSFTITADPDIAVIDPTVVATGTVPGATATHTGKPFVGETVLAGLLLVAGAGALTVAGRRYARR